MNTRLALMPSVALPLLLCAAASADPDVFTIHSLTSGPAGTEDFTVTAYQFGTVDYIDSSDDGAPGTFHIVVDSGPSDRPGWQYEVRLDYVPYDIGFFEPGGTHDLSLLNIKDAGGAPITAVNTKDAFGNPIGSAGTDGNSIFFNTTAAAILAGGEFVTIQWNQEMPDPGACCFDDGSCEPLTAIECSAQGGDYQGDGVSCTAADCQPATGACCQPDSTCDVLTEVACVEGGGVYLGPDTECGPSTCGGGSDVCELDIDGSGLVDFGDLLTLLASWGPCPGCPADFDDSGDVGFGDLLTLLAAFGETCAGEVIALEIVGEPLSEYPHFNFVRSFNQGTTASIALDPTAYPAIVGETAHVYVTADKTAAQWAVDPSLTDVRGGPQLVTFAGPGIEDSTFALSSSTSLDGNGGVNFGVGYDLVVDMDQNGELSGGDFIDGGGVASFDGAGNDAGFHVVSSFTGSGPFAVTEILYSGGTFLGQDLYYPTSIGSMSEVPIVIMSHGNGHNYQWYDYLGNLLASYGYVFMSHQNNTGPGIETASTTTLTNTDYLLENLGSIGGGVLNGRVDESSITWMGHSRGGEGVARAYDRLLEGSVPGGCCSFTTADVRLVSSIAPTDFLGTFAADPHDVDYHLLYGSSDGDVDGSPGCRICQSFSLLERADGFKASTYVHGADHNDFNCCGFDDFEGPAGTAIGRAEAKQVAKGQYMALLADRLRGQTQARDYLQRQFEDIRPIGVSASTTVDNDYNTGPSGANLVIDDFQTQTSTGASSSGGSVSGTVSNRIEGVLDDADSSFSWTTSDPMNGMTRGRSSDNQRGTVFDWNSNTFLEFQNVAPDLTGWTSLQFRACQGTRHPRTTAVLGDLTFSVTLRDGSGTSSSINIGAYAGGIEEPYQRTGSGSGAGWGNEFEVIKIHLTDFTTNGSGIDLTNVVAVRFEFGASHGDSQGRLGMDDILFTND